MTRVSEGADGSAFTVVVTAIFAARSAGNRNTPVEIAGNADRDCKIVVPAKLDRTAIARGQLLILATITTVPDRSDGMDHMPRRQEISLGDLGIAGFAAVERAAFGQQLGPGCIMDRAINATPAEQRQIRRVDDGVNAQRGDVGNNDFQPRLADLARETAQAEAAALTVTPLSANSCCNSPAWNISRMMSQPPTNSPLT